MDQRSKEILTELGLIWNPALGESADAAMDETPSDWLSLTQDDQYQAYLRAKETGGSPDLERVILMGPDKSAIFGYARDVIGGRWPEGEEMIIAWSWLAVSAVVAEEDSNVVQGPWTYQELLGVARKYEQHFYPNHDWEAFNNLMLVFEPGGER